MDVDLDLLSRINEVRRFEPRTLEIAKRLFIHRETPKRLSVEYGLNIQRIYAIRREVQDAATKVALPAGWVERSFRAPEPVMKRIIEVYGIEMAKWQDMK